MRGFVNLAILCVGIGVAVGLPTPASYIMATQDIESYFSNYGYMGKTMPNPEIADLVNTNKTMALEYAVKIFQKRYSAYGLQETGQLDEQTLNLLKKPRCGVKDIMTMEDTGMDMRKRRYLLSNGKWPKTDLSYKITRYPGDYDPSVAEVDREVRRAFQVWEDVTPLRFRRIEYRSREVPDIEIQFSPSYYDHGDGYPFDGPSGTLAHAFFPHSPIFPGDAHFDEAELWTVGTHAGTNFFQVAAHEFGHALGLAHSQDPTALMAPFYGGYVENFQLPWDDVMGIQAIYGPNDPRSPTTTTRSPVTGVPPTMIPEGDDICKNASFDAVTTVVSGTQKKIYGFRGAHFFLINEDGTIAHGYPKLISEGWRGLPNDIDAAFFWDSRWVWYSAGNRWVRGYPATFILKGNQYWRVEDRRVIDGPHSVTDLGWNFPENIDAAIVWKQDGKTYLFKGDQYYKFTEWSGIESGYPRSLSVWEGLPESLDAAFQTPSGEHVFFKGNQHYVYDTNFQVRSGYPQHNSNTWFKYPSVPKQDGDDEITEEQNEPIVDVRNLGRS